MPSVSESVFRWFWSAPLDNAWVVIIQSKFNFNLINSVRLLEMVLGIIIVVSHSKVYLDSFPYHCERPGDYILCHNVSGAITV